MVELWGADHFVFLSNEGEVLREMRLFRQVSGSRGAIPPSQTLVDYEMWSAKKPLR